MSTERSLKRLREMCLVQSPAYAPFVLVLLAVLVLRVRPAPARGYAAAAPSR